MSTRNLQELTLVDTQAVFDKSDNLLGLMGVGRNQGRVMELGELGKNTIAGVDDSTGADGFVEGAAQTIWMDNVAWWASAYSRGALSVGSTCSVGGWFMADVDQYWQERIVDKQVKFVIIGVGLNDIYAATDETVAGVEAALRVWVEGKASQVKAWGGVPIIKTMVPVPNTYFAASVIKRRSGFLHNNWRRQLASDNGYVLLDVESLVIDPTDANANPYSTLFQVASPHPGKEVLRTLGYKLWNDSLKYLVGNGDCVEQATKHTANQLFDNSALAGVGGNMQGQAGTLPNNVWAWLSGASTTYSVEASTDSKLLFAGAPVKSNWAKVVTNVALLAAAPNGTPFSADSPGLMFFSNGHNLEIGDVIRATAEIEIVTPNTLCGFTVDVQTNDQTSGFTAVPSSSFTPVVNADNAKNQIMAATVISLPVMEFAIESQIVNGGVWMMINPVFSGVTGGAGNAVWRVRNPRVWKVQ